MGFCIALQQKRVLGRAFLGQPRGRSAQIHVSLGAKPG